MIEKHQYIIDSLNTNYDIAITTLRFLPLGADMNASVYKAETLDGKSYFVKLKRGHGYEISVTVLALLQGSGIQRIIPPLKTIDWELTQHINDFTLILYPFVDGQNGFCYKGYGKANINRVALAYYRHERIVQDIAEYAQALLLRETGGEGRQEMYQHFIAMFEPNGVVDIAFKTDEGLAQIF